MRGKTSWIARALVFLASFAAVGGAWAGEASDPASAAALSNLTLGLGGSAWEGRYGAPKTTDIDAVLLNARYKIGGLRLTASIPWMSITSPGAVFTGIEGTPLIVAPGVAATKKVRQGYGDLTLGAAYLIPSSPLLGLDVDLIAKVKVPTATASSQLSTGRTDYALGTQVSRTFGALSPFLSVTYRSFGSNAQWRLKDGVATSVGAAYLFSSRVVGVVSYDYAQSASRYVSDSDEIITSVSAMIPHSPFRITGFAGGGLSRGAAAASGGVSLSLRL